MQKLSLDVIATQMKRDALARPGNLTYPPRFQQRVLGELPQHAYLHLAYYPVSKYFWLRISRKGLAPENDFSPDAITRANARDAEVKTFLRFFGAPHDVEIYHGAQELFYFTDCYWVAIGEAAGADKEQVEASTTNAAQLAFA